MVASKLEQLPTEICTLILRQLKSESDRKSLAQCSKHLYHVVISNIFSAIKRDYPPYDKTFVSKPILPGKYQYVKRLELFPRDAAMLDWCYHSGNHDNASGRKRAYDFMKEKSYAVKRRRGFSRKDDDTLVEKHTYDLITERASALSDEKLEVFRWEMKTCVPGSLLGTYGVLPLKQKSLRRLLLATTSQCRLRNLGFFFNKEPNQTIDLSAFRMLEQIDWTTPNAVFIATLSLAIKQNAGHLRRLHLHFDDWKRFKHRIRETEFLADLSEDEAIEIGFANRLFNAPSPREHPTRHLFPELRDLFLSDVPLSGELASAIDFRSLRSLGLHSCPGWDQFLLRSLSELENHQKLKKLEIQDDCTAPTTVERILNEIICTVYRLEELFLSHLAPVGTLKMWENITHHQEDLRHFVHHQRQISGNDTKGYKRRIGDDLGDISLPCMEPIYPQFSGLNLESIGLSCEPKHFLNLLPSLKRMSSLKMIHIRHSYDDVRDCWAAPWDESQKRTLRPEFREFIETVFGVDGLPSVEVIAYGDTSPHELYLFERKACLSFYGAEWNEYKVQHEVLMNKYRHAFEACSSRRRRLGIPPTGSI
ncbi:unnamed protein product [Clonostachys solani]|uniref:F-box domain-containing protein n=1 Tax=Clonostachys solani TaxID=160281 RepID=A0A9N9ZG75_9HYPO|nr:unnamed protein product [Clonostachys solani]